MKKKLLIILICSLLLLLVVQININADSPTHDSQNVFTEDFFKNGSYANQINSSGKGGSTFNHYDNSIRSIGTGYKHGEKYLSLTYGSDGSTGGDNRYVSFQIEFSSKLRNNNNVIDGDRSTVSHGFGNTNRKKQSISLTDMHTYIDSITNQRVYKKKFKFKNYHSGSINIKLYFKNNPIEKQFVYGKYEPLMYLYYKSGDEEYDQGKNYNPDFHIFESAQTFNYNDLVDNIINIINKKRTTVLNNVNETNLDENDKQALINEINAEAKYKKSSGSISNSYLNIRQIKYVVEGNKDSPGLMQMKEDILDNLNKIQLLKFNQSPPDLYFNSSPSNSDVSNLSNNTLNKDLYISIFKESGNKDFKIYLSLSQLNSNGRNLPGQYFTVDNNQRINPNTSFPYYYDNDNTNGKVNRNIKNMQLHFQKYAAPSGNYKGTATWNLVDGP